MLVPLGKRIIIKPLEAKTGALILTNKKPTQFQIISVGDEVTRLKPGDIIFMERFIGAEIEYENEKFLIIEEAFILAKVE